MGIHKVSSQKKEPGNQNFSVEPGIYVVAVSGGVDSMVLLHMLQALPNIRLVIAHFDHGIRKDSEADRKLVQKVAKVYGLPFVFDEGRLGAKASEATARTARYKFLHQVRESAAADAIVTAHHQDDVLETVILNISRGTARKGLSSLQETKHVKRPLLRMTKQQLRDYAEKHELMWNEDSTNMDTKYLRNHIRHHIIPKLTSEQRQTLLNHISQAKQLNTEIDAQLNDLLKLHINDSILNRHALIMLPQAVLNEFVANWLRQHGASFDRKSLSRISTAIKTAKAGSHIDIDAKYHLKITKSDIHLLSR